MKKKIPNALKVGRKSDCSQIGTAAAATFDAENLNWLLNWNWRWTFRLNCLLFRRKKIMSIKTFNINKVNENYQLYVDQLFFAALVALDLLWIWILIVFHHLLHRRESRPFQTRPNHTKLIRVDHFFHFWPNFTISTKFHNFDQITNFGQIQQFWLNFTSSAKSYIFYY